MTGNEYQQFVLSVREEVNVVGDSLWTKNQTKKLAKTANSFNEIAEIIRKESKTKALYEIQEHVEAAYPLLERSWSILKGLILQSGRPNATIALDHAVCSAAPVDIGFTEKGWFRMKMDCLPAKEIASNANYMRDVLYAQLGAYFRKEGIPKRFHNCVIIFNHIYRYDVPEKQYRDHDNIERNMVVDAVALFVMEDDGASRCQHYYYSSPGDENATEVMVVPQDEFIDFLQWIRFSEG